MQIHSAEIQEHGVLADLVYDNDYFGLNPIEDRIVDKRLEFDYRVLRTSDRASGFQGMLLENTETNEYVFVFRGTEPDREFLKDLIIADVAYMGHGTAPQQMKDAMLFVHDMMEEYESISAGNTTIAGHSLGGVLCRKIWAVHSH